MGDTTIQWAATPNADGTVTPGKTWNPLRGCSRESTGCERCYAERIAARYSGPGQPFEGFARMKHGEARWTGKVEVLPDKLREPLTWRKPTTVFVNSMSDLFHPHVPFGFVAAVFAVMEMTPQHRYMVLTKRAELMAKMLNDPNFYAGWMRKFGIDYPGGDWRPVTAGWPLPNVFLGVSVENQATADERIPHLLRTPAAVRFVSAEPLLGPLDIFDTSEGVLRGPAAIISGGMTASTPDSAPEGYDDSYSGIDWLIAGAESGPGARPAEVDWFRALRDQCQVAGVAYFLKQFATSSGHKIPLPELDGRQWREWPA